jgi:hypothetical protein
VAAKKWERDPPGEGLPFFRLTGPALFNDGLNGRFVLKVKLLNFALPVLRKTALSDILLAASMGKNMNKERLNPLND